MHNDAVIMASLAPCGYSFSSLSLSRASASPNAVVSIFCSPFCGWNEGFCEVGRTSFSLCEGFELGAAVLSPSPLVGFGVKKGIFIFDG